MSAEKEDLVPPSQVPTLPNKMEEASSFEHPSNVPPLSKTEPIEEELPFFHGYTPYILSEEDIYHASNDERLTEDEYSEYMTLSFSNHEDIFYSGALARLYWNLEHYPIHHDVNLESMYDNMKLALHRLGIHGTLEIWAYADRDPNLQHDGINYNCTQRQGDEKSIAGQMTRDILDFAFTDIDYQPFILVLSEDYPELRRVLDSLILRLPKVLIMKLPTLQPGGTPFFESADSVYDCTRYLYNGGRKPPDPLVNKPGPEKGSKTVVLWDEGDCPFLSQDSKDHHGLLQKIDSALRVLAIPGEISVMDYLDEGKEYKGLLPPLKRTWEGSTVPIEFESERVVDGEESKSVIEFHPAANKTARLERMFNDIYLWAIHNDYSPCYLSNVIIVADGVREDKKFLALKWLSGAGYSVHLVTPPSAKDTVPHLPGWPGFLFGGAYELGR